MANNSVKIIASAIVFALTSQVMLSARTITGMIVDAAGEPIPGVTVCIEGTTIQTTTNKYGKYDINVPDTACEIQFSFVGMITQVIDIKEKTVINVAMQEKEQKTEILPISYLAFKFEFGIRYTYHYISIEFYNRQNRIDVELHSKPANDDKQWAYSKMDSLFTIDKKIFEELISDALELSKIDLSKTLVLGFDGTINTIEVGCFENTISYKFWTPESDTDKRGLQSFLKLKKKIIKISKMNTSLFQ